MSDAPPVLVAATRDGVVEARHRGHVAIVTADGQVGGVGDPEVGCYPRSAVKPFQAAVSAAAIAGSDPLPDAPPGGEGLDGPALAIACASHEGSDLHQVEAAHVLALAGLDESALACPVALPADLETLRRQGAPTRLAHNCSGKHAAMAWAQTALAGAPDGYADPASPLQRRVAEALARWCGAEPAGVGVDGCGAPAFVLPLSGVARGFARLAAAQAGGTASPRSEGDAAGGGAAEEAGRGRDDAAAPPSPPGTAWVEADRRLADAARAMRRYPWLVGGSAADDTALMAVDHRVVAKRGAEGVLAAGFARPSGPVGVAVKVEDGATRAKGPVVAEVLHALGAEVPEAVRAPAVLGGGEPRGRLQATDELRDTLAQVLAKV